MTERISGYSDSDPTCSTSMQLFGLCQETLGYTIPKWMQVSGTAAEAISEALEKKDISGSVLSSSMTVQDSITDNIESVRLRLQPPELGPSVKQGDSTVIEAVINVPIPFIGPNPKADNGLVTVDAALITLKSLNSDGCTNETRFAVTKTSVIPFQEFSELEFDFRDDAQVAELPESGVQTAWPLGDREQLDLLGKIDLVLRSYVLDRQSRKDNSITLDIDTQK